MNIGCPTFWRVGLLERKTQRFQIPILLVALPREASKPRPINVLTDGLGKNGVIELQDVLRPAPKPLRLGRGLAQAAAALIGIVFLNSQAMAEQVWVQTAYGGWELVYTGPDPRVVLMFVFFIVVAAAVIAVAGSSANSPGADTTNNLPAEIANPQSVDYYQDQTARVHAYMQVLDAEAESARRYIEMMRLKAESAEIANQVEDDRSNAREGW